MSEVKFQYRNEGEVVPQGGSVTHTDYASYYRVRSRNIIIVIKVFKDGDIRVVAEKSLDSGGFISMPWKEFHDYIRQD